MHVHVDEPRQQELASAVDDASLCGNRDCIRWADSSDSIAANQYGHRGHRRPACGRNDRDVANCEHALRRLRHKRNGEECDQRCCYSEHVS